MFVIFLKFAENKSAAPEHMDGHNAWLKQGFDDGAFLLAGSLQPNAGGAILAGETSKEALEARLGEDPFVVGNVVRAEIHEISPARADARLEFLLS